MSSCACAESSVPFSTPSDEVVTGEMGDASTGEGAVNWLFIEFRREESSGEDAVTGGCNSVASNGELSRDASIGLPSNVN